MNKYGKEMEPAKPPYYQVHGLLGAAKRSRNEPIALLCEARKDYGRAARIRVANQELYLFFGPDQVQYILQGNRKNYPKGGYSQLEPLIGNGLLRSEGERWRKQRAVSQPAFHKASIDGMVETMADATNRIAERWDDLIESGQSTVDLEREMTQLTLSVVSRTLFGYDVGDSAEEISEALRFVLRYNTDRFGKIAAPPLWVPTPDNRRYSKALGTLEGIVHDLVQRRRAEQHPPDDLLEMMIADLEGEGKGIATREQLRDEIMTFLTAGHETTAMALTWTFYLLHKNPEKAALLREELAAALGGRPPRWEDIGALEYTDAVLKESMRLYPPVWGLVRKVVEDDVIGGYRIRKGSRLMGSRLIISPYVTHRDPELWEQPDTFRPERWLDGSTDNLPSYAYFPFGGGQRQCIGQRFAMTEATMVLATLAQTFSLHVVAGQKVDIEAIFTLKPANGMKMTLSKIG